jgi:hypothetical protein
MTIIGTGEGARKLTPRLEDVGGSFYWGRPHCHSKFEELKRLQEAGVRVPPFTSDLTVAKQWEAQGISTFGRNWEHTQGKDIVGRDSAQWPYKNYWVQIIPNVLQEWRIQVFDGKCIGQGLKFYVESTVTRRTTLPIRNRSTGWRMEHASSPPGELVEESLKVVKAMGFLYGAVDALWAKIQSTNVLPFSPTHVPYILEINCRPGMDDWTADQYARAIRKWAIGERS